MRVAILAALVFGLGLSLGCAQLIGIDDGKTETEVDAGTETTIDAGPDAMAFSNNIMFVTSASFRGDSLGGLAGADQKCQAAAETAGLPANTYIAFLSSRSQSFASRLQSARGFVRPDGLPVFDTLLEFQPNGHQLLYPPVLNENAEQNAPGFEGDMYWSATDPFGNYDNIGDCFEWTGFEAMAAVGSVEASPPLLTHVFPASCDIPRRLLCLGTELSVPVERPTFSGRHVFVSSGFHPPGIGMAGLDGICNTDAGAASLPGSYVALLASGTQSPAARLPTQAGPPWVRSDGVIIADNQQQVRDGKWLAQINRSADGNLHSGIVWTGAASASSADQTCLDWSSSINIDSANVGDSLFLGNRSINMFQQQCDQSASLYCFQQ